MKSPTYLMCSRQTILEGTAAHQAFEDQSLTSSDIHCAKLAPGTRPGPEIVWRDFRNWTFMLAVFACPSEMRHPRRLRRGQTARLSRCHFCLLGIRSTEGWALVVSGIVIRPSSSVKHGTTARGRGVVMHKISQSRLHFLECTGIDNICTLGGQQS